MPSQVGSKPEGLEPTMAKRTAASGNSDPTVQRGVAFCLEPIHPPAGRFATTQGTPVLYLRQPLIARKRAPTTTQCRAAWWERARARWKPLLVGGPRQHTQAALTPPQPWISSLKHATLHQITHSTPTRPIIGAPVFPRPPCTNSHQKTAEPRTHTQRRSPSVPPHFGKRPKPAPLLSPKPRRPR